MLIRLLSAQIDGRIASSERCRPLAPQSSLLCRTCTDELEEGVDFVAASPWLECPLISFPNDRCSVAFSSMLLAAPSEGRCVVVVAWCCLRAAMWLALVISSIDDGLGSFSTCSSITEAAEAAPPIDLSFCDGTVLVVRSSSAMPARGAAPRENEERRLPPNNPPPMLLPPPTKFPRWEGRIIMIRRKFKPFFAVVCLQSQAMLDWFCETMCVHSLRVGEAGLRARDPSPSYENLRDRRKSH
jgi:hypothetical protein